jgi:SAM-dependent methyltransferase
VTLPLLLSKRSSRTVPTRTHASQADPEISRQVLLKTLSNLLTQMRRVTPSPHTSNWSEYVHTASHYSDEDHGAKRAFVQNALTAARPSRVLDVGCNTGAYSMLAAETGAEVVSIDTDLQAVDRLCVALQKTRLNILPLCVDIAHPTPASGWENRENSSFLSRASGHFDTVMMLAVIHHLLLQSQIPLDRIAAMCSTLATRNLILEWVPIKDPMFQLLLRGRDDLYTHITEAAFREAFTRFFTIVSESTLRNGRILFHLQRR